MTRMSSLREALLLNFTRRKDGSLRSRHEIAGAMAEAGFTVDDVKSLMNYESRKAARTDIARGLNRIAPGKTKAPWGIRDSAIWTEEAVQMLKDSYPIQGISLDVVVDLVNAHTAAKVTKNAVIGKAHRLGLSRDKNKTIDGDTNGGQEADA